MFKSLDNKKIYDNTELSFVFEFFSPLPKRETAAKFARALGKKVKWFSESTAQFEANRSTFKLAPTYSNGYKEMQLSTGFMNYQEGLHMFLKVSNLIESIGFTTDRCRVKTNIKLDEAALELPFKMDKLNRFKYLIGLDEKQLFEMWPQKDGDNKLVYQNHIQYVRPRHKYNVIINESFLERMDPREFMFHNSDFFANDFSNIGKGILSINYISGKDYTKKKKEAIGAINIVVEHLYQTLLNNNTYNNQERLKIGGVVTDFKTALVETKTFENFKKAYPDIQLYVDLGADPRIIEANYSRMRDQLFELVAGGGVTEGFVNFDTHRHKFQVKEAEIKRSIIVEGFEFYNCTVEGDFSKCLLNNCTIKNSKLVECELYSNNIIRFSKLIECEYSGDLNEISASYLDNSDSKLINAELRECLVNRGRLSAASQIDKTTKIIG